MESSTWPPECCFISQIFMHLLLPRLVLNYHNYLFVQNFPQGPRSCEKAWDLICLGLRSWPVCNKHKKKRHRGEVRWRWQMVMRNDDNGRKKDKTQLLFAAGETHGPIVIRPTSALRRPLQMCGSCLCLAKSLTIIITKRWHLIEEGIRGKCKSDILILGCG